jgi:hypothetical protein
MKLTTHFHPVMLKMHGAIHLPPSILLDSTKKRLYLLLNYISYVHEAKSKTHYVLPSQPDTEEARTAQSRNNKEFHNLHSSPIVVDYRGRPSGLRNKMSSPAQTLRSWVRIPLDIRMSVAFLLLVFLVRSSLETG